MKKVVYKINDISCTNCVKTITNTLDNFFGENVNAQVNVNSKKAYIRFNEEYVSEKEIKEVLKKTGYPVDTNDSLKKEKRELIMSIALSIPLLIGMLVHALNLHVGFLNLFTNVYIQWALASVIQFYIGRNFYVGAYNGLKMKVLGMDFLIVLGSLVSYIYSIIIILLGNSDEVFFEVSALIITIVLIGKYIESKAQNQTTKEVDLLLDLAPKKATVIENGKEKEVLIENLNIGDEIICYGGDVIAADSVIIKGSTKVDESSFTGESVLVTKTIGDTVIGGSINEQSTIYLKVNAKQDQSMINQIVNTIEEASLSDTKYQKVADKVSTIFVPLIVSIAIFTFILNVTYLDNSVSIAITHALAVILISCPCALGLATPTSIMVSNQISSKHGILYKGSKFFELANSIDVIFFDKTGTLTKGKPQIKDMNLDNKYFDVVYSVEKHSKHPISKEVCKFFKKKDVNELEVDDFEIVKGRGIKALVNGKETLIGNIKFIEENNIDLNNFEKEINEIANQDYTFSIIAYDGKVIGYYTLEDEIKQEVIDVIKDLNDMGIETIILTGDNEKITKKVAKEVNITKYFANMLPIDKARIVKEYKEQNKVVAMIGDGINDAVALKVADIGISVANASEIALETSDVVLMKNDLKLIVDGMIISRETVKNIKRNFLWAFSYNIIAIPLAMTGNISMLLATFAMSFSSIIVVLNSMRLKKYKAIKKISSQ